MRLFTRYTIANLGANVFIFIIASVALYFSLRFVLVHQIDEDLRIEETEILNYVNKYGRLPESISGGDQVIRFSPAATKVVRNFSNSRLVDAEDHKPEDYRRLVFEVATQGKMYEAEVLKSLESTNNLLRSILTVSILTILTILAVSAVMNRYLLKRLWKPFYASLEVIKNFRISRNESLQLSPTTIDEFDFMNATLKQLADTAKYEYTSLKTFSENASHEIQTPIAIVRSKLDLLLQEEALSENGSKALQAAFGALERVSRLNKSLLLLAKIENNQFEEKVPVDMEQRLREKLADFSELWLARNIHVDSHLQKAVIGMNSELAFILLNNLLANATVHNYTNGQISIALSAADLVVSNTGANQQLDERKLFQRFYKNTSTGQNNGLGLSIVKQICDVSGFDLSYQYTGHEHRFIIEFSSATLQTNSPLPTG